LRLPLALLLVALVAQLAQAQVKFDPAARAKAVAPYIDDMTVAVVHVDVSRLDLAAASAGAQKQLGVDIEKLPPDAKEAEEQGKAMLAKIQKHVVEAYIVVSLNDVPVNPPYGVVILKEGADAKALLADVIGDEVPEEELAKHTLVKGNVLVIGMEPTIIRLKGLKPIEVPNLARAFEVAGDTLAQAVLVTTDNNKATLARLMEPLPPPLRDTTSGELVDSVKFISLGIDPPPAMQIRLGL
jgi:hypothetical protein